MKVIYKKTGQIVDVTPYYLYGRVVAYIGDKIIEGTNFGKYAYLRDELADLNQEELSKINE